MDVHAYAPLNTKRLSMVVCAVIALLIGLQLERQIAMQFYLAMPSHTTNLLGPKLQHAAGLTSNAASNKRQDKFE
jgi:hypothetical protein